MHTYNFSMKKRKIIAKYTTEYIFLLMSESIAKRDPITHIFGIYDRVYSAKIKSKKLNCFMRNSKCVSCGLAGNVFYLVHDTANDAYALLLFHESEEIGPVEMTMDHIIPRCKGGNDNNNNLQTMCYDCNQMKAGSIL